MNDLPLAPDAGSPNEGFPSYVWVLNRSTRAVRVETTSYGSDAGWSSKQVHIPPGTSAYEWDIDYIGPEDKPPPREESFFPVDMEHCRWLTWDRERGDE